MVDVYISLGGNDVRKLTTRGEIMSGNYSKSGKPATFINTVGIVVTTKIMLMVTT
jgi:hypothetical protein